MFRATLVRGLDRWWLEVERYVEELEVKHWQSIGRAFYNSELSPMAGTEEHLTVLLSFLTMWLDDAFTDPPGVYLES